MKGFLKRTGGDIFYEVTGKGPALIFSHGLGGNYLSWWQQIPHFSERFTCVTYSHRGFWPNAAVTQVPEITDFVNDLSALIDHLQLEDVTLVAQSFGGWACLEYTLLQQSRVRSLVMASTTGTLNYSEMTNLNVEKFSEWKAWSELEKKRLVDRFMIPGAGFRMADELPSLYYLFKHFNELTPVDFRTSMRTAIHKARTLSPQRLTELTIPILFVTGEEDLLFPPEAAMAAASLIKSACWKSIPKTGHSTYFESPQLFNTIVDEFLSNR